MAKLSGVALRTGSITERTAKNLSNFSTSEAPKQRGSSKQMQYNLSLTIKNPLISVQNGLGYSTNLSQTSKVKTNKYSTNQSIEYQGFPDNKRVSRNTFLKKNNSVETR